MIEFACNWARSPAYDTNAAAEREGRAISLGFANHFRRTPREAVFESVIAIIPPPVQAILGNPDLEASHFLWLPLIPTVGHLWGVYLDAASLITPPRPALTDRAPLHPVAPLVHSQHPKIIGTYVGSSTAVVGYPGISGRVQHHLEISIRDFSTLNEGQRSKHYSVICRTDVAPNFWCLA
ncbi:hypothetical protein C8A05DRAFT_20072, partial [Staphylotrichum tortipilum]